MLQKSLFLATALAALAAGAQAATTVKEVEVEVDLTAIKNEQAGAYWTSVADDLENAIVARLTDRIAEDGAKISVDLNEVSLANSFETRLGLAEAVLEGNVTVTSLTDNSVFDAYDMQVSMENARTYLPAGSVEVVAFSGTPEYYAALIDAFADAVVVRLK